MQVSLFGSAVWLWSTLLARSRYGLPWLIGAALISSLQLGLLGALITLAPLPVYDPHLATTYAWGLTPLEDQQLGGVIMGATGAGVFLLAAVLELSSAMRRASFDAPTAEPLVESQVERDPFLIDTTPTEGPS